MAATPWTRRDFLKRSALAATFAGGASGVLAACSKSDVGSSAKGKDLLAGLKKNGIVRVGFANESPYGYADSSGKLTGEAPEVARAVFKKLGVPKLEGVLTEFGSLIGGLNAGRFDVIAAGMFINPDRCKQIAFSDPDYCVKEAFLVKKGNPKNISTYKDVASSGAKLGVLTGAVEGDYAKGNGVEGNQLQVFPDQASMYDGLSAGRVDAISLTSISLRNLLSKHKGASFELTDPFTPVVDGKEQKGCGGYGFRNNEDDLRKKFNAQLQQLKSSGELLSIIKPFGFSQAEIAGPDDTAAKLCKG